jgi:hypothetical protein
LVLLQSQFTILFRLLLVVGFYFPFGDTFFDHATRTLEIRLNLTYPKATKGDVNRGVIVLRFLSPSLDKTVEGGTGVDEITLKDRAPVPISLGDVANATATKLAQLRQHEILSESTAAKASGEQDPKNTDDKDITVPLFKVNRALEVIVNAGDQLTQVTNESHIYWKSLNHST